MARNESKRRKETPARKKACKQCTQAKVRCGLQRPQCSRCAARNWDCQYFTSPGQSSTLNDPGTELPDTPLSLRNNDNAFGTTPLSVVSTSDPVVAAAAATPASHHLTSRIPQHVTVSLSDASASILDLDFTNLDLVPVADSIEIQNRWLKSFFSSVGDQIPQKNFHPYTIQFASCVLRSYPKHMLRDGGVPPIIHPLQVDRRWLPVPLANCYSLVRLWETRVQGSEAIVIDTVKREMERLLSEHDSYNEIDLLAAFQAYLIYALLGYFSPIGDGNLVDHSTIMHLQELGCRVSATGLMCAAELSHTRPRWESWLVATAKRRTLHTMYLFSNVFNATHHMPVYLAYELKAVPVSSNRLLWEARDRAGWEREYDCHLSVWADGEFLISELWRSPETGTPARRERIDRWLRTADDFGMMLFATAAHLHGC
ncbi:hypothetical protein VTN77DRAFT_5561 [Rasamsonia byssochlamydoides]|uniref:uncharacterized protein n=1 Tax=Rasamsonia byssochlamydoides TaxID=89139 RepID=UPI003744875B